MATERTMSLAEINERIAQLIQARADARDTLVQVRATLRDIDREMRGLKALRRTQR